MLIKGLFPLLIKAIASVSFLAAVVTVPHIVVIAAISVGAAVAIVSFIGSAGAREKASELGLKLDSFIQNLFSGKDYYLSKAEKFYKEANELIKSSVKDQVKISDRVSGFKGQGSEEKDQKKLFSLYYKLSTADGKCIKPELKTNAEASGSTHILPAENKSFLQNLLAPFFYIMNSITASHGKRSGGEETAVAIGSNYRNAM